MMQKLLHCFWLWDNSILESGALSWKLEPWRDLEVCMSSTDCSCVHLYAWHGKDGVVGITPMTLFRAVMSVAMLLLLWLLWISQCSEKQLFKHIIDKEIRFFLKKKVLLCSFRFCWFSNWQSLCLSLCNKPGVPVWPVP